MPLSVGLPAEEHTRLSYERETVAILRQKPSGQGDAPLFGIQCRKSHMAHRQNRRYLVS